MLRHPIQIHLQECFAAHKDRTAIEYGDSNISYSQLEKKTGFIANVITAKGIKRGSFIGILLEDRVELIAVIIGILKAGCVFVPLDTAYPAERLRIMLRSTNTKFLFCNKHICAGSLSTLNDQTGDEAEKLEILYIDAAFYQNADTYSLPSTKTAIRYSLNDSIYIYFTSGTSGKPKAIIGQNKGLLHFINWEIQQFGITRHFRLSQFISQCHDGYLRDLFIPLFVGGTICIPPGRETLLESHPLKEWLERSAVNLVHCTPGMFNILNASILNLTAGNFPGLKYIMLVGERIIPAELSGWYAVFAGRVQLVNFYGHTETTLVKMFYLIKPGDSEGKHIPIGQPIAGAEIMLLDPHLKLCEPGEIGEIYIRTPHMTLGYCNEPELTARYFMQNPFTEGAADPVYKSGDLGRLRPDLNVEFIGRADRQVKIRGFRVELAEIENELLKHEAVSGCAADFEGDEIDGSADGRLTVYYVPGNRTPVSRLDLRTYLQKRLPAHMLPSRFISLQRIPLTQNGKIDYKTLRSLREISAGNSTPPGNRTEQKLWKIWCDILHLDNVGVDENFLQVGGNSLNIMALITKIHKEFEVRFSLGDVFNNLTIKKQAGILNRMNRGKYIPIEPSEKREYYALSSAQQKSYVLQQVEPDSTAFNFPGIFVMEGDIESFREKFQDTFLQLIKRHETLRTTFQVMGDEPAQQVHEEVEFEVRYHDSAAATYLPDIGGEATNASLLRCGRDFIRPFDLAKAPLMRVGLLKIEAGKHLLMLDMHHIISDAISLAVMLQDFMQLYRDEDLPRLRLQYRDFSQWQQKHKQNPSPGIKKQETYWLKMFAGEIPSLNLPGDFKSPPGESYRCGHVYFTIHKQLYTGLKKLLDETGITLYMALLTGYFLLLSKYTRQEDIVIGSHFLGRNHPDLENIIGMFIDILAIRAKPQDHKLLGEFIEEVKENTLNAVENSDFQLDDLVNKLGLDRDPRGNTLFETLFDMVNSNDPQLPANDPDANFPGGLKISPLPFELEESPFNLVLHAMEKNDGVNLSLCYSTALFKRTTIEKMAGHYIEIIKEMSEKKQVKLADIKISHDLLTVKPTQHRDNQQRFHF